VGLLPEAPRALILPVTVTWPPNACFASSPPAAPEHIQPSSAGLAPALKLLLDKQPEPENPEDSGDDEWDH